MKTNIILQGDCIEEMKKLESNSIDAIVTDPPYGLEFMGKEWDKFGVTPARAKRLLGDDNVGTKDKFFDHRDGAGKRGRYTEMTLKETNTFQEFIRQFAVECLRILKPGGFLLSFGGTRTYHRMTCGIEDAGFEIRDTIMWLYGSGFPKSTSTSLLFDKRECMKQLKEKLGRKPTRDEFNKSWENFRKVVGKIKRGDIQKAKEKGVGYLSDPANRNNKNQFGYGTEIIALPFTKEAKEWEGWGTALKPAVELIVVARKPLSEKNVALNVLKWGTGGINIDACRIGTNELTPRKNRKRNEINIYGMGKGIPQCDLQPNNQGRFPANIILDKEAGRLLDEQNGNSKSGSYKGECFKQGGIWNKSIGKPAGREYGDKGGASRFFYCAKASKSERNLGCEEFEPKAKCEIDKMGGEKCSMKTGSGNERNVAYKNNHPTVKPIKLMEYLVKLVSREGAIVLDPFLGSGTTAIACQKLNRKWIGIEKEEEYIKICEARIKPFTQ